VYWRRWRADHPEYRARQRELRNARRRKYGRGDRSREYARRKSRAGEPLPPKHEGHWFFEIARGVVGPRITGFHSLEDPLYDDLLSVAVLAILEGEDVKAAVDAYRRAELSWGRITAPLLLAG